ncbi:MAG: recombinase RecT [Eubacteriales bacterium]|nr:recombinase RecT [Eubacteriales bacterium]
MATQQAVNQQMAQQPPAAQSKQAPVPIVNQVKAMLSEDKVKKKFTEILGQKAPQFMASITNTVSGSAQLKKCPAASIIGAAFVAATYDLPIDSNLGFAAIVPYNESVYNPETRQYDKVPRAQFQMMYKGFIQLAIRSGYYEKMNYAVVYEDELRSYNPITGEIQFVDDFDNCTQRNEGDEAHVAGYYAWFRLKTGYSQELYMSKKAVDNHARKYSQAYRYDLNKNKKSSKWTTDFEAMALKTVIKLLLSKWGILSVDMQRAIQDDQKTYDEDGRGSYGDNKPDALPPAQDPFQIEQQEEEEPEDIDIEDM